MGDLINLAERNGSLQSPVLVIIAQLVLTRTCIMNILNRELAGFEIVELATPNDLGRVAGRDVRLVLLDIGDKLLADPGIEDGLGAISLCRSLSSFRSVTCDSLITCSPHARSARRSRPCGRRCQPFPVRDSKGAAAVQGPCSRVRRPLSIPRE
jgi:hypothetical protein